MPIGDRTCESSHVSRAVSIAVLPLVAAMLAGCSMAVTGVPLTVTPPPPPSFDAATRARMWAEFQEQYRTTYSDPTSSLNRSLTRAAEAYSRYLASGTAMEAVTAVHELFPVIDSELTWLEDHPPALCYWESHRDAGSWLWSLRVQAQQFRFDRAASARAKLDESVAETEC